MPLIASPVRSLLLLPLLVMVFVAALLAPGAHHGGAAVDWPEYGVTTPVLADLGVPAGDTGDRPGLSQLDTDADDDSERHIGALPSWRPQPGAERPLRVAGAMPAPLPLPLLRPPPFLA